MSQRFDYNELLKVADVSDVAPITAGVSNMGKRLEFATLHNEMVPMKGVEQISFQINRSYDLPNPLVEGLIKLHSQATEMGMAIKAGREAKMETLAAPAPLKAKAIFNPKLGM